MNEFNGVADTMLIPMAARIYVSKRFPEYFYDETALSLEGKIPAGALERIYKSSSEYTMLASVARYYNFDEMIKNFLAQHEKCNIVNLGAGLETAVFRLQANGAAFYEIDLPEVIELRKNILGAKENETLIGSDIFTPEWADRIDTALPSLLIVSGVFQYFREEKILQFLADVKKRFPHGELIFDATNAICTKNGQHFGTNVFLRKRLSRLCTKMRYGTFGAAYLLHRRTKNVEAQTETVHPHCDESVRRRRKNDYLTFKVELSGRQTQLGKFFLIRFAYTVL